MIKNKGGRPVGSYDGENVTGLGYFLGEARKKKKLSLRQVTLGLGISVQYLSNIEHDRAPLPAKYINKIASVLEVEPVTLAAFALQKHKVFAKIEKVITND